MTTRRSGNIWDRRGTIDDPNTPFGTVKLARPERRKDADKRVGLDARAAVIIAELPAPKKALKTSAVKHGIYAALRHGICHS